MFAVRARLGGLGANVLRSRFAVKPTVDKAADTSSRSFASPDHVQQAFLKEFASFRARLTDLSSTTSTLPREAIVRAEAEVTTAMRRDKLEFVEMHIPTKAKLSS
eukprot:TRINITY_DN70930_c0_g1_i1.p2 TRINITY_DN70930_c0_g1~~TRINITY_DN70930_c0_g1_i1.p2  ORF type:complete len:105 (+),score=19.60 TRINITY_DN70930_c0_g1_i1:37-351(+)